MKVKQAVSTGVLFMVDLAGSERAAITQVLSSKQLYKIGLHMCSYIATAIICTM